MQSGKRKVQKRKPQKPSDFPFVLLTCTLLSFAGMGLLAIRESMQPEPASNQKLVPQSEAVYAVALWIDPSSPPVTSHNAPAAKPAKPAKGSKSEFAVAETDPDPVPNDAGWGDIYASLDMICEELECTSDGKLVREDGKPKPRRKA
jgi:hypothetical protein